MNYKGHLIGGAVAYSIALYILINLTHTPLTLEQKSVTLFICLFGALFPDIDTKSKIQIWVYRALFAIFLGLIVLFPQNPYIWTSTILLFLPLIVHHRGLFHNKWFLMLLPLTSALILSYFYPLQQNFLFISASFFILGTFSHLALDKWK